MTGFSNSSPNKKQKPVGTLKMPSAKINGFQHLNEIFK